MDEITTKLFSVIEQLQNDQEEQQAIFKSTVNELLQNQKNLQRYHRQQVSDLEKQLESLRNGQEALSRQYTDIAQRLNKG